MQLYLLIIREAEMFYSTFGKMITDEIFVKDFYVSDNVDDYVVFYNLYL